jgi:hypothetical protein
MGGAFPLGTDTSARTVAAGRARRGASVEGFRS